MTSIIKRAVSAAGITGAAVLAVSLATAVPAHADGGAWSGPISGTESWIEPTSGGLAGPDAGWEHLDRGVS